jgi:hypothetical protein
MEALSFGEGNSRRLFAPAVAQAPEWLFTIRVFEVADMQCHRERHLFSWSVVAFFVARIAFSSARCFAGETLISSFEGNLSTAYGIDWQNSANSSAFVSTGATLGSLALSLTTPRTQSIPLKLTGGLDTVYASFMANTELRADFTVPASANYREAFFRLQVNGGAATIDGSDMILTPGATVTGAWKYADEGVFDTLQFVSPITSFSLQLGVRGPDLGSPVPPTSMTTVDNIRWFTAANPGDFNNDGEVDAADYTVWRDHDGSSTALPNDNMLGTPIGNAHYQLWRDHFGSGMGAGGGLGAMSVPEPPSFLLMLTCTIMLSLCLTRR